jgi:hypothetical protein
MQYPPRKGSGLSSLIPTLAIAAVLGLMLPLPGSADAAGAVEIAQSAVCDSAPQVDPWRLPKALLMGNAKASYYYKHVVIAGDTASVTAFLDCYNLRTKQHPNYASGYQLWAACKEITGPIGQSQMVCVAMDGDNRELDDRILDDKYARQVAATIFR